MNVLGIISIIIIAGIALIALAILVGAPIFLYATRKVWLSAIILWLAKMEIYFDQVKEGYVAHYESGGKFIALACSYGEFAPVEMKGDLDWAIRRIGEREMLPCVDRTGTKFEPGEKVYTKDDFYPDRRSDFVKKIFGAKTGIVCMGPWPATKPRYYNLRISNFRTVKPSQKEIDEKQADVKVYFAGGNTDENNAAGYLISWNEWTKQTILSDDNYPIPVDGVRVAIGTSTRAGGDDKEKDNEGEKEGGRKKQAVVANILVIIRGRIREPYLFFYRAEDTLETVQNEMIQHIRQLCAGKTIEELYSLKTTLESDKAEQINPILSMNNFGSYIRERYGFSIKSASFAYITILGAAGEALSAPFVAQQNAEAARNRGVGEGDEEYERLTRVGAAYEALNDKLGLEGAKSMREADVAQSFAESGKSSTVVLGFDSNNFLGSSAAVAAAKLLPAQTDGQGKEDKK